MTFVHHSLQPSAFLPMASRRNHPYPRNGAHTPCSSSLSLSPESLLGSLSDQEHTDEDGVDVVMRMLDASPSSRAPIISPTNIDRLFANWNVDLCAVQPRFVVDTPPPYAPVPTPCDNSLHPEKQWCYGEDCTVADVFTRVVPDRQKEEIKKRLPGRRWSDAVKRFRSLCCDVVDNSVHSHKRTSFWRRSPHTETSLRIQCPIKKTLAKFR
ncbi:unnamed protein product [Agarophyton chilense]|eukprot:gb/GEZJ01000532.1/.p1 GENE.gb/GEZJ01000532.1/~~gb/GEZJ01000532.1/.p1  ORF type:complete len:211 (-),score=18.79 gb/GEZJ01000532.1/:1202-1834(-)